KALKLGDIISFLLKVAEKEHLNKSPQFLKKIAIKSQGDLRAALNDLESYSLVNDLDVDVTDTRNIQENIFNILRRIFKERSDFLHIYDKSELSLDQILLWIEENIPKEYGNEALAKAYYA